MKLFPYRHVVIWKNRVDIIVAAVLDIIVIDPDHHHVHVLQVHVIVDVQQVVLDPDLQNVVEKDHPVVHHLDPHTDDLHQMIDVIKKEDVKGIKIDIHHLVTEVLAIIHLVTKVVNVIEVVIVIVVAKIGVVVTEAVKGADVVIVIGDKGE